MQNKSDSKIRAAIDSIINEIRSKSADGDYIYRGEREKYEKISSSLYREYAEIDIEEFDLMYAQREMLKIARNHIGESPVGPLEDFIDIMNVNKGRMGYRERSMGRYIGEDTAETIGETIAETAEREVLTELQHYGGKTNLIDFTTDYFIAIFFACSGDPKEVGRIILLEKNEEIKDMIVRPRNPRHRVIAQKSVFLQPPQGYIEVPNNNIVYIPADLKQSLLDYLRKFHDISTESIYNDIHGFISYQNIHQSAYVQFSMGRTLQFKADETKSPEEKQAKNKKAIKHYNEAINLNPDIGETYHNRGWCWLNLHEWKKAAEDLAIALNMKVDVVGLFRKFYENVADFEKEENIVLPPDIARMLGDVRYKKEQPSVHVDDISPDEGWTVERFNELLSSQEHSELYESRNQTEKLCEFGADLMALVENKRWKLTHNFRMNYFALYFGHRRVFGVSLYARPKLAVWLPEDILRERNYVSYDDEYTYRIYDRQRAIYSESVTVADIDELLEFAYSWYVDLLG